MNENDENLTLEEAQQIFRHLVEKNRSRCLWFTNPLISVDITRKNADRILNQIARKAPRSSWLEVRKLKRWRLQNFNK